MQMRVIGGVRGRWGEGEQRYTFCCERDGYCRSEGVEVDLLADFGREVKEGKGHY